MNTGTRLILSAALAVGSTIGAAALGQTAVRDAQAEVAQAPAPASTGTTTTAAAVATTTTDAATSTDIAAREAGVRSELLAAAEAGEISWAAAERVGEDLAGYIRGDRSAGTI